MMMLMALWMDENIHTHTAHREWDGKRCKWIMISHSEAKCGWIGWGEEWKLLLLWFQLSIFQFRITRRCFVVVKRMKENLREYLGYKDPFLTCLRVNSTFKIPLFTSFIHFGNIQEMEGRKGKIVLAISVI